MTGVSGSGKSSLAFNTIYAEGQRRYVDSLSAYARQFLGNFEKPDVDSIEGLSPSISIDQKTTNNNPRSTVGTVTEIYDYLRLLYARIGTPYCPIHNVEISSQSIEEMVNKVLDLEENTKIMVISPIVRGEKGTHKDRIDDLRKSGYTRVKIDGDAFDLNDQIELSKTKKHNIDVIIDRLIIKEGIRSRLYSMFSFNSPFGACPECKGLGFKQKIDEDLIIPNKALSLNKGAIVPLNNMDEFNIYKKSLEIVCNNYDIDMNIPVKDLKKEKLNIVLYGSPDEIEFDFNTRSGNRMHKIEKYEGISNMFERRFLETNSTFIRDWLANYMTDLPCEVCHGTRLKKEILNVKIKGKNIYELCNLSIRDLYNFFETLKLNKEDQEISKLIIKDIKDRLSFLINVGLEYLNLNRTAGTLSGGESQRIRLATQIGSRLSGILYVLDEPSIGLHQRDNQKLINSLLEMRDLGNTLIVVEHDTETMMQADYLIDIGPLSGAHGGHVMAAGTPEEVMNTKDSITGQYFKK